MDSHLFNERWLAKNNLQEQVAMIHIRYKSLCESLNERRNSLAIYLESIRTHDIIITDCERQHEGIDAALHKLRHLACSDDLSDHQDQLRQWTPVLTGLKGNFDH